MNNNFIESILAGFMKRNGPNLTATQQGYIDTIKSGNASRGEQVAMNICNSMGLSKEEAIAQARNFFGV